MPILLLFLSLLLATACSEDKKSGGGGLFGDLVNKETERISAEQGGEVRLDSGGAAQFPGMALTEDTDVTNAEYEPGEQVEEEAVSNVFNITPETPVGLNGRYRVILPYDPAAVGDRIVKLRHRAYETSEQAREGGGDPAIVDVVPFQEDRENKIVTADVDSFGAYWVAAVDRSAEGDAAALPVADAGVEADRPLAEPTPDAAVVEADRPMVEPGNTLLGELVESTPLAATAAMGGTANLASGMTVNVLAGSLGADAELTVAEYLAGAQLQGVAVSNVLVFTPDAPAELLDIASVGVPYDTDALGGRTARLRHRPYATTEAVQAGGEGEIVDVADAQDQPATHTVFGTVTSFGAYWVEAAP